MNGSFSDAVCYLRCKATEYCSLLLAPYTVGPWLIGTATYANTSDILPAVAQFPLLPPSIAILNKRTTRGEAVKPSTYNHRNTEGKL